MFYWIGFCSLRLETPTNYVETAGRSGMAGSLQSHLSMLCTILYHWFMVVKPVLMLILCLALIPPWFLYISMEYLHTKFSGVLSQMLLLPTFNCLMLSFLPLALNSHILLLPLMFWILISLIHWNARLHP